MPHYLLIRPTTGEIMGETKYGLVALPPAGEGQNDHTPLTTIAPKLLTSIHVAENHQSAMNCEHGNGWEIATVDLAKGIVDITKTASVD